MAIKVKKAMITNKIQDMSVHNFLTQLFPNEGLRVFMTKELLAPPTNKIYILCGNGANGKSTFMKFANEVCICSLASTENLDAFWKEIKAVNAYRPIFVHAFNLSELGFLDSSDLWDRVHIIPMTSRFVDASKVNEKTHNYLSDYFIGDNIGKFAKEFLDEHA